MLKYPRLDLYNFFLMKKKSYVWLIIILIILAIVLGVLIYFWISYIIELSTVQDAVKVFLKAIDQGNTSKIRELSGGRLFVNIFGMGIENLEEVKKLFPPNSQILFFKTYRPNELSQEEKRDYGFYAWKVNIVVINEKLQFVGGYSFFVSKITEITDEGKTIVRYKVVDIKNVGSIIF
jgi:hypothetical protein